MQNDDENKGAGFGTPIDPADFARVRVAKILRSEKPLNEQEDARWNMLHNDLRMIRENPEGYCIVGIGQKRRVMGWNIFGKKSVTQVIWFMSRHSEAYRLGAANLNSRYVKPPWA